MANMKMYDIIPGKVYQRGEFIDFPLQYKLDQLELKKIDIVVCMIDKKDKELAESKKIAHYAFIPIADGPKMSDKSINDIIVGADFVSQMIVYGHRALVHCHGGRNRSSLFSALLVMKLMNMSGADAVEYLREVRPNSFSNPYFVDFVKGVSL